MAVDKVFHNWVSITVEYNTVIHNRLVHVAEWSIGVFYADNRIIGSRDPRWLQGGINILIGPFLWIGLMDNVAKSKPINCQLGEIWLGMSEEEVGW